MAAETQILSISSDESNVNKKISIGGGDYYAGIARIAATLGNAKRPLTNMFFAQGDDTVGADTLFGVTFRLFVPIQIHKIFYYNSASATGSITAFKLNGQLMAPEGYSISQGSATNWLLSELFALDDIGWDLFVPGNKDEFTVEGVAVNADVVTIGILGELMIPQIA